jgi:hypothetical protein
MAMRARRWLSTALLVVTGVALFVAVTATWMERTLFDSRTFADHAVRLLDSRAVRDELSRAITDQLVERGPSPLASYRSLLEPAIDDLLATPAFEDVLRSAVREAHAVVVERHADTAVLDLGETLGMLAGSGASAGQPFVAHLPADASALLIDAAPVLRHLDLWRIGERLDRLDVAAWIVTVVAAIGALVLAPRRRAAVVGLGGAVALAGVAILLAVHLAPRLATIGLGDREVAAAVVSGVLDFTADFAVVAVWLIAAGVLVAAAASARAVPHPVEAGRELLGRWSRAIAGASRPRRALAGVLLVALAVLAIIERDTAVLLAVVVIGALVAYTGAVLVAGAIFGPAPAGKLAEELHEAERAGRRVLAVALPIVVVAVMAAGLAVAVQRVRASTGSGPRQCNGHAELCDRRLDQVAFAGSHNSMAAEVDPGWLFAENIRGIPAQLESGIRALLVKTHYGVPTGVDLDGHELVVTDTAAEAKVNRSEEDAELGPAAVARARQLEATVPERAGTTGVYLCHVYCSLGSTKFADSLGHIRSFLDRNPHEVIMLFIGDYVSPADTQTELERAHLIDRVWHYDTSAPPPTLGEMIDARRNLLVLAEHDGGTLPWYTKGYGIFQDTPFTFTSPSEFSCRPNRGPADAPLFELNHFITPNGPPRIEDARIVNAYDALMGRARQCQAERRLLPNIVAVNFSDQGDLFRVVDDLNGVG